MHMSSIQPDNAGGNEHYMSTFLNGSVNDNGGTPLPYICELDLTSCTFATVLVFRLVIGSWRVSLRHIAIVKSRFCNRWTAW